MNVMNRIQLPGFLGILLLVIAPAFASEPAPAPQAPPMLIRGTVGKLDGQVLTVNSRNGQKLSITLAPDLKVAAVVKRNLTDIKAGDYVASTSRRGSDGALHAIEVHVFPEEMRGVGEGQYPWDLGTDSLMTNATVTGIASAPQGQKLKVSFKGSESEYVVAPDVPVVGFAPGDTTLLKPGAAVFLFAVKKEDGGLLTNNITAEKDGVKPPM